MKILIVTHYFLPHMGGIEIVAYNQAKELVKKEHKVTIISSKIGDEPEKEIMDGIKVRRVKAWNWFEKKYGIPYPIFSWKILKVMNEESKNVDIIYTHDFFYLSTFVGAIVSKLKNKPLILMQHVGIIKSPRKIINFIQWIVAKTYGKFILKNAKKAIVCNPDAKNSLKNIKVEFIENGVDISLFKPVSKEQKIKLRKKYKLPLNKPIVLFVGRFVEKKGFDKLFEARDKDYLILFVGEGIMPSYIKKDPNIKIINFLEQDKLREVYQASDIFCLPSKNEGFPLTILEAMSSGLPIITSNHPGYDKYLDKKYVKLINQIPIEIKKSIKEILSNKGKINQMSKYSRDSAVKRFSWKINTEKLEKLFKTLK